MAPPLTPQEQAQFLLAVSAWQALVDLGEPFQIVAASVSLDNWTLTIRLTAHWAWKQRDITLSKPQQALAWHGSGWEYFRYTVYLLRVELYPSLAEISRKWHSPANRELFQAMTQMNLLALSLPIGGG